MHSAVRDVRISVAALAKITRGHRSYFLGQHSRDAPWKCGETIRLGAVDERGTARGAGSLRRVADFERVEHRGVSSDVVIVSVGPPLEEGGEIQPPVYGRRDSSGERVRLPLSLPTSLVALRGLLAEVELTRAAIRDQIASQTAPSRGFSEDEFARWRHRADRVLAQVECDLSVVRHALLLAKEGDS